MSTTASNESGLFFVFSVKQISEVYIECTRTNAEFVSVSNQSRPHVVYSNGVNT